MHGVARRESGQDETREANRSWWDAEAPAYYAEHGAFLGDADLVWGPEGWTEEQLGLLSPILVDNLVLEIGAGAAQGARWLRRATGARVVATDLSREMLRTGAAIDARLDGAGVPLAVADGLALPFGDETFELVFTAYGVVPFVADSAGLMREVCRVLRPGGRFVFSTTHPVRWAFPDVPGTAGLTADGSYFDRTPYVEVGADGGATYVEHHRTLGDRVRELRAAGLTLDDLVEPEWPADNEQTWGGWSPLRGAHLPGTAVFVCRREGR